MSKLRIRERTKIDDRDALKSSQKRRDELEKLAIMHTGQEVYVQISGSSAYADIAKSDSEIGYTDRIIINVRLDIPEQKETNLDEESWDYMVQKTDLYHELGHVLYTDWPSFENTLLGDGQGNYGVVDEHKAMFKNWQNLIEDAVIERLLIDRFNLKSEFRITNENLIKNNPPGNTVSLHEATSIALIEYKHPVGWIDDLLDESNDDIEFLTDEEREIFVENVYPQIEDKVPDILDETDAEERNYMIYELYKKIGIFFDESVKPGMDENHTFNLPDDANKSEKQTSGNNPDSGNIPDIDLEGSDAPGVAVDEDVQRDYSEKVETQKQSVQPNKTQESVEEWSRAIDTEYDATDTAMSLRMPDDPPEEGSFDDATKQEAKRLSQPLARDLRQRLHHQQRTEKQRKKKSGKVDSTRLHKTSQGDTNVFKKTSDPDEKDYSCMIVLDRSGSMSGEIVEAEKAVGALAFALEDVGVDVSVLSHLKTKGKVDINLEKDFPETVDEAEKKLFRGAQSGGTPLSDALMLGKARFNVSSSEHPFMIVVTDGEPDNRERYRDLLHQCDFPVLGVYIKDGGGYSDNHMNEAAYFHQLELREKKDVLEGVKHLTKSVMF
jgi:Mg-chelatase subunit ChlD